jgi:hypothetical protein
MTCKAVMKVRVLHREQMIPVLLPEVFSFFSEARNLDRITPPWLHFQVLDQTDREIRAGTLIHYRLARHGLPISWTTLIEEWCPPTKFVDVQLKGPYSLWRHTHSFEACDSGTLIRDTLQEVKPGVRIGWTGKTFGIRALHVWEFKGLDGRTHVKTCESFERWLARLFPGLMRKMLRRALDVAIGSLKAECERGPAKG